jgi:8-oxo-dGTP diphosphatase
MPWPLHMVTVAGLVEDGKGNVLLTKSAMRRAWETCGGQVEAGENLEEALLREIREESGVDSTVRCLTGVYSSVKATVWHDGVTRVPPKLHLDFLCDYVSGELRTSDETTEEAREG